MITNKKYLCKIQKNRIFLAVNHDQKNCYCLIVDLHCAC